MDGIKVINSDFGPGIEIEKPIQYTREFILGIYDYPEISSVYDQIPISSLQVINGQYTLDPGCYFYQPGEKGYRCAIRVPKDYNGIYGLCVVNNVVNTKKQGKKIDNIFLIFDEINNQLRISMNRSDIFEKNGKLSHGSTDFSKTYYSYKDNDISSQIFVDDELHDCVEELFSELRKCKCFEDLINLEELYTITQELTDQKER